MHLRAMGTITAVTLLASTGIAGASVPPKGLNQTEAVAATIAAVRAMAVNGSPGAPSATCTRANWMAFRCSWSRGVTAESGDRYQVCKGKLTVVRKQVKGYPLAVTRTVGTSVTCANSPFPTPGT